MLTEIIITEEFINTRLDKFLSSKYHDLSRVQIQELIKNNKIFIKNNIDAKQLINITKVNYKLKLNQVVLFNEDHFIKNIKNQDIEQEFKLKPYDYQLDIKYEDDDLIIINKPKQMTIHPNENNQNNHDSLVNALISYGCNLSDIGPQERPGIVHRLDRDTTGLMIIAKNNEAHEKLANMLKEKQIIRKYIALVWGTPSPQEATIDIPIGKSNDRSRMKAIKNKQYISSTVKNQFFLKDEKYKDAVTHYKTTKVFANKLCSQIECQLQTGRTHQIRVHMSHIGHSIIGDKIYGKNNKKINQVTEIALQNILSQADRQMLHSFYLEFNHPVSDKKLCFTQSLPLDMQNIINSLESLQPTS